MSRSIPSVVTLRAALPSVPGPSTQRPFHTTPIFTASSTGAKSVLRRKLETRERKKARIALRNAPKPQPNYILGHIDPPIDIRGHRSRLSIVNNTIKPLVEPWEGCRLSKILLHPQTIWNLPVPDYAKGGKPEHLIPGLSEEDRELIFGALPHVTTALKYNPDLPEKERDEGTRDVVEEQGKQSEMLLRIMDLRNAGRERINAVNRRRVIDEFGGGWDTGNYEVQAALMTLQIRGLNEHMLAHKKDVANRRALNLLIHQRAKILKYVKRTKPKRYDTLLADIGLTKESVEGELITRL